MDESNSLEKVYLGALDKKSFLQVNSVPVLIRKYANAKDISLVSGSGELSLVKMKTEYSEDYTLAYVEMWILSLNDFLNVKSKMNPAQIKETALYILQDYYYFNLADLAYFFSNAKKGHYGEYYNCLDGRLILSWLKIYANERAERAESRAIRESDEYRDSSRL